MPDSEIKITQYLPPCIEAQAMPVSQICAIFSPEGKIQCITSLQLCCQVTTWVICTTLVQQYILLCVPLKDHCGLSLITLKAHSREVYCTALEVNACSWSHACFIEVNSCSRKQLNRLVCQYTYHRLYIGAAWMCTQ